MEFLNRTLKQKTVFFLATKKPPIQRETERNTDRPPPPASNHERIKVSKRAVAEQGRDLEKLTTTELTGGKFRNCFKQIPCKFKPFSPNGA